MKMTKIAAIVAAAALLIVGAAFTSMAETGWQYDGETWTYFDAKENQVFSEWVQSGADYYWLDDNGEMLVDSLVEPKTGKFYYVDASGKRVANTWIKIVDEDDSEEYTWYYFGSDGKAYKNTKTEINGKTYIFDTDSKMLYGWIIKVPASGQVSAYYDEAVNGYVDGTYYCGEEADGSMTIGWKKILKDTEDEDTAAWFYFKEDGKKVAATEEETTVFKKIGDCTYGFKTTGEMLTGWVGDAYYDENGSVVTKGWFQAYAPEDAEDKELGLNWYYATSKGQLAKSQIKSIGGKKYLFNDEGIMQSGLLTVSIETGATTATASIVNYSDDLLPDSLFVAGASAANLYYFGSADDGSMKTGTHTITLDDNDYTLTFSSSASNKGLAINGWSGSSYYINGKKFAADGDVGYAIVPYTLKDTIETFAKFSDTTPNLTDAKSANAFVATQSGKRTSDDKGIYWTFGAEDNYLVVDSKGTFKSSMSAKDGDDYIIKVEKSKLTKITLK